MPNPFHEDVDDVFRGVRVRVRTEDHSYEGWCGRWHYDDGGVILHDAERDDGDRLAAVTLRDPLAVERIEPTASTIEKIAVDDIAPSPYTARTMDDADHEKFVKLTRERGHLLTYPTVRAAGIDGRAAEDEPDAAAAHDRPYEIVAGHRRFEAARRADLDAIAVRIADLDAWGAVRRFVDDHVPIRGGDERHMYGQEEIDEMLVRLRAEWPDERLREIGVLAPYLSEKLAPTRSEAMRRGHLGAGGGG